jgi:hypothetical protein
MYGKKSIYGIKHRGAVIDIEKRGKSGCMTQPRVCREEKKKFAFFLSSSKTSNFLV